MKAKEFEDKWDSVVTPRGCSWEAHVIVITEDGQIHPVTSVYYNESLGVYVISTCPKEKT